ncbi:GtrA family protein [Cohnella sp. CFH 77786]|uniref:GtrA family protein n=1 Tax=Cohnella sp. CFH 77786 TaxID=2662265 RepID=UPI001C60C126|nr:GtrA family protein [Cohnella sp. CFH 77786]MBW5447293.1 GtrA family protein [Cohnella sp. CFH 77786]
MLSKEQIRMAKFGLVGLMNTGVDFAVFVTLVYGLAFPSVWAQVISYGCGVASSYLLNRKWTFASGGRSSWSEIMRFAVVNGASFGLATGLLLGLEQAGWTPALAKGASILISTAVNYAGSRYWVFRMESRENRAG